jgi:hypothetical protein
MRVEYSIEATQLKSFMLALFSAQSRRFSMAGAQLRRRNATIPTKITFPIRAECNPEQDDMLTNELRFHGWRR